MDSGSWRVDLTSIAVPLIGLICEEETNKVWILAKSLSKSNCHLQVLSDALALEFSPSVTK